MFLFLVRFRKLWNSHFLTCAALVRDNFKSAIFVQSCPALHWCGEDIRARCAGAALGWTKLFSNNVWVGWSASLAGTRDLSIVPPLACDPCNKTGGRPSVPYCIRSQRPVTRCTLSGSTRSTEAPGCRGTAPGTSLSSLESIWDSFWKIDFWWFVTLKISFWLYACESKDTQRSRVRDRAVRVRVRVWAEPDHFLSGTIFKWTYLRRYLSVFNDLWCLQ